MVIGADANRNLVSSKAVGIYFHNIVDNLRDIVKDIIEGRRIKGRALELYHLAFPAKNGTETDSVAAASAWSGIMIAYIPCLEPEQRHPGNAQCRDCNFTRLVIADRIIVFIKKFDNYQLGLKMSAAEISAFREG